MQKLCLTKKVIIEFSSTTSWEGLSSPLSFPNLTHEISRILRSLNAFDLCQIVVSHVEVNAIATKFSVSVTKYRTFQSYMSRCGPTWLSSLLRAEATGSDHT